jgi:hypothetical protein
VRQRENHTSQHCISLISLLFTCRDNLEVDLQFWHQLEYVPTVNDLFDQARNNPMIAKVRLLVGGTKLDQLLMINISSCQ